MTASLLIVHAPGVSAGTLAAWATVVALLVAAAGVIGAAFRNGRTSAAVRNWRNLAESYEATAKAQDEQLTELRVNFARETEAREEAIRKKDLQISALQERVATLQDLVTGRAAFEQLNVSIAGLVAQLDLRSAESLAQISEVRGELRGVTEGLEKVRTLINGGPSG